MAVGTSVIASDIPVFQEIYQNGAQYFDPHDVNSFVAAVQALTSTQRQKLQAAGTYIASHYSWDTMAFQTLSIYKDLLGA